MDENSTPYYPQANGQVEEIKKKINYYASMDDRDSCVKLEHNSFFGIMSLSDIS
jgi:hypothetical protein